MNFAKNLTREYKATFNTLDVTNKLNLLDNDTELYSAGKITSVSFYGDFAHFKNLSCVGASFQYVEFDELYSAMSTIDKVDVLNASIVNCSIGTLNNVSFTNCCTVLDRTNVSLGSFTNTSFTQFQTCFTNACIVLDYTNVSLGSFTNTSFTQLQLSFTNASTVLDRTNVSLGSFTNTSFTQLQLSFTNACTILDRTNVSLGSFTNDSFTAVVNGSACSFTNACITNLSTVSASTAMLNVGTLINVSFINLSNTVQNLSTVAWNVSAKTDSTLNELRLLEIYVENVSSVARNAFNTGTYLVGYTETVSGVATQALDKANSLESTLVNITGDIDIDQATLLNLSLVTWGSVSSTAYAAKNATDYLIGYTESVSSVAHDAYENDQYTLSQHNSLNQSFYNVSTLNMSLTLWNLSRSYFNVSTLNLSETTWNLSQSFWNISTLNLSETTWNLSQSFWNISTLNLSQNYWLTNTSLYNLSTVVDNITYNQYQPENNFLNLSQCFHSVISGSEASFTNACITNVSCVNASIGTLINTSFMNLSNLVQNLSTVYYSVINDSMCSFMNACITNLSTITASITTLINTSFINLSTLTQNLSNSFWNVSTLNLSTTLWNVSQSYYNISTLNLSTTLWNVSQSYYNISTLNLSTTLWNVSQSYYNVSTLNLSTTLWNISQSFWNISTLNLSQNYWSTKNTVDYLNDKLSHDETQMNVNTGLAVTGILTGLGGMVMGGMALGSTGAATFSHIPSGGGVPVETASIDNDTGYINCVRLNATESINTTVGTVNAYLANINYLQSSVSLSANKIYSPLVYITDTLNVDDIVTSGVTTIQDPGDSSKTLYVCHDINDPGLMFHKENVLSNKVVVSCNNDIEFQVNNNPYITLSKNFGMVDLNTTELNSGSIYTPTIYSTNVSTRNCSMWSASCNNLSTVNCSIGILNNASFNLISASVENLSGNYWLYAVRSNTINPTVEFTNISCRSGSITSVSFINLCCTNGSFTTASFNTIYTTNTSILYSKIDSLSCNSISCLTGSFGSISCTNFSCVNACIMNVSIVNAYIDPCTIDYSHILNSLIDNACITNSSLINTSITNVCIINCSGRNMDLFNVSMDFCSVSNVSVINLSSTYAEIQNCSITLLNNISFINLSNLVNNLSFNYYNNTVLTQVSTTNACITNLSCVNVSVGTLNNVSFTNLSNLTHNLSYNYWNSTQSMQVSTTNACIINVSCVMGSFTNVSCVNVSVGTLNNVSFINLSNLTHNLSNTYWNNTHLVQISTTNACITNVSCAMGSFTNASCVNVSIGTLNNVSFINLSNLTQNLSNSYWNSTVLVQLSTTNACITNVSCAMGSFTNVSCVNVSIGTLNNVSFTNLSNLTHNLSNSYWNSTVLVQLSTTNACITNVSCAMGSFTNVSCVNVSIGTLNNVSFINLSNLTQNLSFNFWSYTPAVQISTTNACITNLSAVSACITNVSSMNVCLLEIRTCSLLSFRNNGGDFLSTSYRGARIVLWNSDSNYSYYGFGITANTLVYNSHDKHRFQSLGNTRLLIEESTGITMSTSTAGVGVTINSSINGSQLILTCPNGVGAMACGLKLNNPSTGVNTYGTSLHIAGGGNTHLVNYDNAYGTYLTASNVYLRSGTGTTTRLQSGNNVTISSASLVLSGTPSTAVSNDGALCLPGTAVINFGYDQSKDAAAGKISYGAWDNALCIVGYGTNPNRLVRLWDHVTISENLTILRGNSAPTSTQVGYVATSSALAVNYTVWDQDTWSYCGINLALTPGSWIIFFRCRMYIPQEASLGYTVIALSTSSSSLDDPTARQMSQWNFSPENEGRCDIQVSRTEYITSNTTYYAWVKCHWSNAQLVQVHLDSKIKATRIC